MILLGMIGNNVIKFIYTDFAQIYFKFVPFFGIDRIYQSCLFFALNNIAVITGAFRKGYELIEYSSVPM